MKWGETAKQTDANLKPAMLSQGVASFWRMGRIWTLASLQPAQ
jgi:hypothetical protein